MNSSLELLPSGNFSDGSLAANVTVDLNGTLVNVSSTDANGASDVGSIVFTVLLAVVLGAITLMTVIGNIFVICAIRMDRNLRTAQNYLVFSLAVADLMVSIFVMPLSAVQEVNGGWKLGAILCDIWTFADVMSCTASILHLLAIALDRYWAVTNIDYIQRRSANRILTILAFVWGVALTVSLAPLLGWKDPDFEKRILENTCMVSQDKAYQIFATFSTFYGPLVVILLLYWKIYQVRNLLSHLAPLGMRKEEDEKGEWRRWEDEQDASSHRSLIVIHCFSGLRQMVSGCIYTHCVGSRWTRLLFHSIPL